MGESGISYVFNLRNHLINPHFTEVRALDHTGIRSYAEIFIKRFILQYVYADIEFADDVALITDTIEGAKLPLDRLEKAALSVGLAMNDTKT